MNILMTGGTGFVGTHLTKALHNENNHIYILTRSPHAYKSNENITYIGYDANPAHLPFVHAVINLAGDTLFGYWSKKKKEAILSSRVDTTEKIITFIKKMNDLPLVFINGSAVGFYGTSDDSIFTEETTTPGDDFLADVVVQWEKIAKQAEPLGIRTVYARFGVILGDQGALPMMSLPVKMFVGGKIGHGEQWLSWIHIDDVVELIIYCIHHEQIKGPVNITSPNPRRNDEFTKTIANVMKRPFWFPTPVPLVRLVTGEMSMLITKGQYVLPQVALDNNYSFIYPELDDALKDIFN